VIPVVFQSGGDLVQDTLMNRPGGNVMGVSRLSVALEPERLELLHEVAPQASVIGFRVNPLTQQGVGALLVAQESSYNRWHEHIVSLAARYTMPAMYGEPDLCRGRRALDSICQVGVYVGRILKGEKPADMPVRSAHHVGEFLAPSIAGASADKAALKKSRRSGTKAAFNAEVTRQRNQ
jgi:putative tryptophan/tyrosine transport system substrate-binding protein